MSNRNLSPLPSSARYEMGTAALVWSGMPVTERGASHLIGAKQLGIGEITGGVLPIGNRRGCTSERNIPGGFHLRIRKFAATTLRRRCLHPQATQC
jgi:hypothetical protein